MVTRKAPMSMSEADINEIQRLYEKEFWGVRRIAGHFNTNHHFIQRRIDQYGFTSNEKRCQPPLTEEHRIKIGKARKKLIANGQYIQKKGYKTPKIALYKNMLAHLKFDVTLEWLQGFEDIEKLKFLNRILSRHGQYFDTQKYVVFIEKFYFEGKFNQIYEKWLSLNKDKWFMPSIDHIHPKALGGNFDLSNLRFITWLENRAKADMSIEEWEKIKANISDYFV